MKKHRQEAVSAKMNRFGKNLLARINEDLPSGSKIDREMTLTTPSEREVSPNTRKLRVGG